MSTLALDDVLNRSLLDGEFRRAVQADPDTALDGFDLTDEERSAIRSRSFAALTPRATSPEPPATIVIQQFPPMTHPPTFLSVVNSIAVLLNDNPSGTATHLPARRAAELTRRGDAIVRMAGDRVEPIKDLLALMR